MKKVKAIKRFFILMLAILTLVGFMPVTASADVPYSSEYDGDEAGAGAGANVFSDPLSGIYNVEEDVDLPEIPFMTLLEAPAATSVSTAEELAAVFQYGGEAVLDSNVTLSAPLVAAAGKTIVLDLNGKTIDRGLTGQDGLLGGNVITVQGSLTLNDSGGTGEITGGKKSGYTGGGGVYVNGGVFTMNGGSISGNVTADGGGGGVFVDDGTFVMNGGAISGNSTAGGGGGVRLNDGEFTMSGGSISDNTAKHSGGVFVDGGTFTMNTGVISGNIAAGIGGGYGGGVSVLFGGSFIMKDGEISSNMAEGYDSLASEGGGVLVYMSGSFTFEGGTIKLNEAEYGGGVYLDGSTYLTGPASSFTMSSGEISQNTADSLTAVGSGGGGVYVASGDFNITGGTISRNEAKQGGGIFMLNGSCTITNCEIIENITSESSMGHGGGVYLGNGSITMNSGKINKNKAAHGGGLYVLGGTFSMKNGQINENMTYALEGMCDGGGVYLNAGAFVMEGGEIRGNSTTAWYMYSHGGGVAVYGGSFLVSGSASIIDNSRSGVPNNVYLKSGANIIEVTGTLTGSDGTVGISVGNAPEGATSLVVAQGSGYSISEADRAKFTRDLGGSLNLSDNKIVMPDPSTSYLKFLAYNANGGSGTHSSSALVEGMDNHFTVASGDEFSRTNCTFAGWNTKADGSGDAYQAGDTFVLTDNTTLYAQWNVNRASLTLAAPLAGASPSASAACNPSGITAAVVWKQGGENLTGQFDYNTVYSAEITLTAGSGCKFDSDPEVEVNAQSAGSVQRIGDTELVAAYTFAKTGSRSTPAATLSPASYNIATSGGIKTLTLNVSGISEGSNSITWTMSKTDGSNILTLPSTTSGALTNGALDLGSVAVAGNATGQPAKTASVTIDFGGNEAYEYAGVPASITVTFRLAAGDAPEAEIDYINERITGVSDEMEYLVDGNKDAPVDWTGATTVNGTEIALSGIITNTGSKYIHIRYRGISGSAPANIKIPARPDLHDDYDWVEDDNIINEDESGWVPWDCLYRINDDTVMPGSSDECLEIHLDPGDRLTFWLPATASSFKSGEITVTAPARLAKTNVVIDFQDETLNTTTAMQYSLNMGKTWTDCTENMALSDFGWNGTAAVTVQFRYPATDTNYASDPKNPQILTIPVADGAGSITMSSWTYGSPALEPVPVSATNGTGSVTYTYSGTKADGTPYSSSTKPSDAGSYTVTAAFAETSEYKPVISEPAGFTILKKGIAAQWTNLQHVYDGTEKAATLALPNLEPGDAGAVSASISDGQRTNAGFQRVTASLGGSRAFNYVLTNPEGTLTIQRAPVTFTVGNNVVLYDGESKTAAITGTANGSSFVSFTVIYKQDGTAVPTPAAAGIYDIYASFADTNYRHVDGADGVERKIGVLTVFEQAPEVFKTSFIPGNGSGTMDDLANAVAGTVRILPDCTFTEAAGSYVFVGWMLEGDLYPAGAAFIQPARNVSFTAQWAHVHSVSGEITWDGSPADGAVVTLMYGSQKIGEAVADALGRYQFNNVPPGIYNLAGAMNGITKTIKTEVTTADVTGADLALPVGRTNSVVEVRAGTPAIVVGNLEKIFDQQDDTVFTLTDQGTVTSGGAVEIRIIAEVVSEDTEDSDQKMITDQAQSNPGLYLEISLKKSVNSGGSPVETSLPASNVLLDIVVPLPPELQGKDSYIVYRCHNGATVQTLTTTQNGDGEYITVNAEKTAITIHAKLFSTYAIGYLDQEVPANAGSGSHSHKVAPPVITIGLPYYLDANGNKIFLGFSDDSSGTMKYLAPEGKTVLFGENPKNFKDIGDHWAKSDIDFVAQREIFQGTGKEIFSPDAGMTRGMFAAAIGRLYERSFGRITSLGATTFTDVAANSYYAAYADWAEENNIMKGSGNGKFNPNRLITREEMASVLYRFARFLELSGTETTGIQLNYSDTSEISSWAVDAAKYCQETNLIAGRGNGIFASKETATRAEVATILQRFIKAVVK